MVRTRPAALTAALVAAVLAVLLSAVNAFLIRLGVSVVPVSLAFGSPVLWPLTGRASGTAVLIALVQFVLIGMLVALVTTLAARGTAPGRGFGAVLFAVWLGAVLAGYLTGPIVLPYLLRGYDGGPNLFLTQLVSSAGRGGGWGFSWGWLPGVVAGLVHRAVNARAAGAPVRAS
ncbi:ABC-type transport system involved in multi-copper enzyme maturation permease subunit [Friedmanniella endophytica]|uniref:ABC-type transport system involved in multi-copper enzyme maturation permease subunit n=1 Tax=Microlunatus kandeliicorticis TaxID=1759536 RepID=A0A7W3P7T0_9ACTN|nr:hypothetical protein [Microlunatus kandeliicorticis]MBA8796257.1 ABC-type transport system involved in multi-copper enzyme maturation permease subunit [Microlunatus kandeliicorticis]